ncbi:acyl-CoA thioester hydrolase/BAAT C-terminal domain-containing protein [Actinosynnema sp. NPDC050801]|uniref:acyl-CoA thioester hydrolase/BAAT C-terminal domain-containing protein n=1 Tax=unclassified Actinosynnema TaxID=2637065 RepID=UPI0033CC5C59
MSPRSAPVDAVVDVRVVDLPPDERVEVRASTGDWSSSAVFLADERGVVDLTRHAPVKGSYSGVDPMGLFWSMSRTGEPNGRTVVEVVGVGEVELDRLTVPEGVKRTEVRENGLVGVLFEPDDDQVHPGVVVLGGSEGGLHELDAALLAGHGFAALALAYFGAPGVPEDLVEIPLEYFGTALEWLGARAGRLGVVGGSRGGEAALLLGVTFPQVKAVVSVVGSGVVTQCIGPGSRLLRKFDHEAASWTWQGRPLPYLPYSIPDELRERVVAGKPVRLSSAFDFSDGIPEDTEIPVERIGGGVLLLSSGSDDSWPSVGLSEVAWRRLTGHGHAHRHERVVYPEAGHVIAGPPHRPVELVVPGPGVDFSMGGTPAATAAARADAWRRTVEFLSDQLGT